MFRTILTALLLMFPFTAQAAEYHCQVQQKFNSEHKYTQSQIEKGQFSVRIEENGSAAFVSRCSYTPSEQKVICDRYAVDKVVQDSHMKIKKYYVFRSQFDVQLWPSLAFVENNGRGGIAFGKCTVVAP